MKKLIFKLVFVIAVAALAWFSVPVAIVAICATLLVALHDKANSIIEFSFGPLKAKLEREISDAEKLVEKLRTFAVFQAKAAVTAGIRTGRWAGNDEVWQFQNAKHFEKSLREIQASDDDLKDVRSDLVWFTIFDAGHSATGGSTLPMHLPEEARREWSEARENQTFLDPDAVATWLAKWRQLTRPREVLIEDMRWMKANQDVRDVEQYLRAKQTVEWDK